MKIKIILLAFLLFIPVSIFYIVPSPALAAGQGERCQTDGDCNTGTCANNACAGCDQILLICMPRSVEGADCIETNDCVAGLECGAGGICVRPAQQNQQPPQNNGQQQAAPAVQTLPNPLGTTDVTELIARVIRSIVGIVGSIGLLMFIYGGFTWMTAGGNEKRVEQGKQILTWAVLGLVIIFSSYAILSFVIDKLTSPTEQVQNQPRG